MSTPIKQLNNGITDFFPLTSANAVLTTNNTSVADELVALEQQISDTDQQITEHELVVNAHPIVPVTLTPVGSDVNTNAALGTLFRVTLSTSSTLQPPTNAYDGQAVTWFITHGADNNVITLDTIFKIPASATLPLAFSTTTGLTDIFAARFDSVLNKWYVLSLVPGY